MNDIVGPDLYDVDIRKATLGDGGCRGVKGAEAAVPSRGAEDRHEVVLGELGQLEIGGHETGKRRPPGGDDETSGGRGGGPL